MKSIKQQYIDLQEGNMTQANFMRNLRMTLPQYITNVTSFDDSVRILRNKGILTEVINPSELAMGIKVEMEHTNDMEVAKKIAIDHLAENPHYYSDLKSSGIDTPQGLGSTTGGDVNLNKANPKDGFSLGFFEEGEDKMTAAEELAKNMGDYDNAVVALQDEMGLSAMEADKIASKVYPEKTESLNEAKDEKGKWTNTSGKSMYDTFKEIDNLNGQEVLIGIDYEMIKNPELTKAAAAKIVIKNLKKNPIYYTAEDMSGVEGYEPEYLGGKSANAEARQMQPLEKNMSNVVDKKMGMQPVKGIEKPKKDADAKKETNTPEKGISLMSLIAKTSRGVKKMDATGEKMKKIAMKEVKFNDFPSEKPGKISQQIATYIDLNKTLRKYSDDITLQSDPDGFLRYGYWEELPADALKALELQYNVEMDTDFDEDAGRLVFYSLAPKYTPGKINLNKVDLMKMIREELMEMFDGMEPMDRTGLDEMNDEEEVKAAAREYGMKLASWYNKNRDAFVSDPGDDVEFIKKMFKKTTPKPQRPSIMYDIADNKILADKFEQIVDDIMRKSGWEGTYDI